MLKTTQLHTYHQQRAKLTEFAGYEMPLWYTTTTEEHLAVRNDSGIFDVSHMGRFVVRGDAATTFIEGLVPTHVASQPVGKSFYTLFLNEDAGIIDDLIVMKLADDRYMLVVNAANANSDMRHIMAHAPEAGVEIEDQTPSSAMIAVQGPGSPGSLQALVDIDLELLKRFRCADAKVLGHASLVSRTGYTGEDGFEVIIHGSTKEDPGSALQIWERLAVTSAPCGLGARDSLRLEAGFPLHGSDIDEDTDPFQADLAWLLSVGKLGYVGAASVADLAARAPEFVRRGVVLDQGIPRHGFKILDQSGPAGMVTSGTFSPILRRGIALCKIKQESAGLGTDVKVVVRDFPQQGRVTKPPFYDEQMYGWKRRVNGK